MEPYLAKEHQMRNTKLSYVKDPRVARAYELAVILQDRLQYPNSETSLDEQRYTEWFEEEILKLFQTE
jgi:hypothetical protein